MDRFETELVELLPRLRRFGRAIARDIHDADDLVQIAVERALGRRASWRTGTRLDSWMFTIMRNAWTDEVRMRGRRGRVVEADTGRAAKVADPAQASIETRLTARAAERALEALPEEQRMPVALVLIEGLSYREAAEVLGIPEGTLTSRLSRGRAELAATLLEGGGV
ncbi:MAG TPA: sigma-70 family RNA polymerase sigma factor [Caulobacteraceae bacterium]